jgi:hypothetical protein
MISPSNPTEVTTIPYEKLFAPCRLTGSGHPLNEGLGGYIPGTVGRRLWPKTPEYVQFPTMAYGWGIIHPVQGSDHTSSRLKRRAHQT